MVSDLAGVTVLDLGRALLEYPDLVHPYLGSLVPSEGTDLVAGTFIHVAAGAVVADPVHTFFGREVERMAATSRTLIVAEPGSSVAYIEGCAAPIYTPHHDRRSTVEVIVGTGATVRHTTIQNWSTNARNTVVKHATVAAAGRVEWVDAALGSSATTTRLVTQLRGDAASASVLSMVSAAQGQRHDVESLVAHEAEQTSSDSLTKLLGSNGGSITSRQVLQMSAACDGAQAKVRSESLVIDGAPDVHHVIEVSDVGAGDNRVDRSSDDARIDEAHVAYLMRRGLSRVDAIGMIVTGYLEPIARSLPLEYSIEWEQAIQLSLSQVVD